MTHDEFRLLGHAPCRCGSKAFVCERELADTTADLRSLLQVAESVIEAMRRAAYTARANVNTAMFDVEQQAINYQRSTRPVALPPADNDEEGTLA